MPLRLPGSPYLAGTKAMLRNLLVRHLTCSTERRWNAAGIYRMEYFYVQASRRNL